MLFKELDLVLVFIIFTMTCFSYLSLDIVSLFLSLFIGSLPYRVLIGPLVIKLVSSLTRDRPDLSQSGGKIVGSWGKFY